MPKKSEPDGTETETKVLEDPAAEHRTAYDHARESSPADGLHPDVEDEG